MNVFAALADPTRRRLLDALRPGERSVLELVERVGPHQPGVSRHLRVLRDGGLVQVRKDGKRRLYSVAPQPLQDLDAWLASYRDLWQARFTKLEHHLKDRQGRNPP